MQHLYEASRQQNCVQRTPLLPTTMFQYKENENIEHFSDIGLIYSEGISVTDCSADAHSHIMIPDSWHKESTAFFEEPSPSLDVRHPPNHITPQTLGNVDTSLTFDRSGTTDIDNQKFRDLWSPAAIDPLCRFASGGTMDYGGIHYSKSRKSGPISDHENSHCKPSQILETPSGVKDDLISRSSVAYGHNNRPQIQVNVPHDKVPSVGAANELGASRKLSDDACPSTQLKCVLENSESKPKLTSIKDSESIIKVGTLKGQTAEIKHETSQDFRNTSKSSFSLMQSMSSKVKAPEEKLFFDPKRIFATSIKPPKRPSVSKNTTVDQINHQKDKSTNSEQIRKRPETQGDKFETTTQRKITECLNNDKPGTCFQSTLHHSQFINNHLSDFWEQTDNSHSSDSGGVGYGGRGGIKSDLNGEHNEKQNREPCQGVKQQESSEQMSLKDESPFLQKVDNNKAAETVVNSREKESNENPKIHFHYLSQFEQEKLYNFAVWASRETSLILYNILKLLLGVIVHEILSISYHIFHIMWSGAAWLGTWLKQKWSQTHRKEETRQQRWNSKRRTQLLSENISLPDSGDEAIRRLFACEGKDPYSILGLKIDCSDEEIRKYYRRQAVLVHPDKCHEPGAEEAFKILSHAFELIGEPEKRQAYDAQTTFEHEEDIAMQQFTDLLTKLHETMEESMQYMGCSNCGGRHKRLATNIQAKEARYCEQCDCRHSAKEGDVWAETSMLGFLWKYYACMEGTVYDVTEWASCQQDSFRHIPANSHLVKIHISTGKSRQQRAAARDAESELKDIFDSMFGGGMNANRHCGRSGSYQQDPGCKQPGSKRRRRKRH